MPLSDIVNKHLVYTYDNGWKYEFWLKSEKRIVYAIHGGPMAGRKNYQTCAVQEVCLVDDPERDQVADLFPLYDLGSNRGNLPETGTVVSIIVDLTKKRITTYMAFSRGHWDYPKEAHGDKRNPEDFERWRKLAEVGKNTDREIIPEQATLDEIFEGRGDLEDIDETAPTI
ncbi:hypothetical protein QFC22_004672 [Naganishia vaughanmartiniae]|uniref:Uncharacterized protein n=1 Tax=Naganishia vaughanmartiniae TaxID=1424756 RepID=A0ACC2X0X2_9TREE|nr:hypothetical protein QFC22_004672 [Naganishia vaughanmartiniae]